jgi:hypothetical protein
MHGQVNMYNAVAYPNRMHLDPTGLLVGEYDSSNSSTTDESYTYAYRFKRKSKGLVIQYVQMTWKYECISSIPGSPNRTCTINVKYPEAFELNKKHWWQSAIYEYDYHDIGINRNLRPPTAYCACVCSCTCKDLKVTVDTEQFFTAWDNETSVSDHTWVGFTYLDGIVVRGRTYRAEASCNACGKDRTILPENVTGYRPPGGRTGQVWSTKSIKLQHNAKGIVTIPECEGKMTTYPVIQDYI